MYDDFQAYEIQAELKRAGHDHGEFWVGGHNSPGVNSTMSKILRNNCFFFMNMNLYNILFCFNRILLGPGVIILECLILLTFVMETQSKMSTTVCK